MDPFYFNRSLKGYEKAKLREQEAKLRGRQKEIDAVKEDLEEKVIENNSIIKKIEEIEEKILNEQKEFDRKIKERKTALEEKWRGDILEEFDKEEREKLTERITLEVKEKFYKEAIDFINQSEF